MKVAVLSLIALGSLSCLQTAKGVLAARSASIPEQIPFVVRSLSDSVTWEERAAYRRFSVTVQFVNRGTQPLYRHWCAVEVQRLIDGIWVTVQDPICVEGQPEFIALGPGDSAMQNVNVYRYPDPAHWYGDRRLIAGVYRLMFPIGYNYSAERGLVPAESESARSTQAFIVRDP
jgi:hypothetical protein